MKTFSLAIVCVALFSACSKNNPSPVVQIPLVNADMESGTTQPTAWFVGQSSSDIAMIWATNESSSPTHSLEMSRTTDSTSFAAWGQGYSGTMPVGRNLTFKVKIKADNVGGNGLAIAIRVDGVSTTNLQFSTTEGTQVINGTFDWTTYTVRLPKLTGDAKYIVVYLIYLPTTTGKAYFDDASLEHD